MKRAWLVLILILALGLMGCQKAEPKTNTELPLEEISQIIASDLAHHGIQAKQLTIHQVTPNNREGLLVVDFSVVLSDGREEPSRVTLYHEQDRWVIDGHRH